MALVLHEYPLPTDPLCPSVKTLNAFGSAEDVVVQAVVALPIAKWLVVQEEEMYDPQKQMNSREKWKFPTIEYRNADAQ